MARGLLARRLVAARPVRALLRSQTRLASTFMEGYKAHVAERAEQGIVAKPLDAAQTSALVELLQRTGRGYRVLGTGPKLILRHATSLNRMYTHIQRKEAHPFGGTSNEDVAIQLLPSTASSPAPVADIPAVTPPAAIQPAVPAASGEHMLAPGINFF